MMSTQPLFNQLGFALLILSFSQVSVASSQNCDTATDLLFRAYHLYNQGEAVSQQKLLFSKSLQLCPNRPNVQTTLASILYKQGFYEQAIHHYKQAIRYDKKFYTAWHGLGESYYQQKRFPLSLETHLSVCQNRTHSMARVRGLLKEKRYAMTKRGDLIDQESLLVLYAQARRQRLNQKIAECGFSDIEVQPLHIFTNFGFDAGKASIPPASQRQLDEIVAALQQINSPMITIHGHTDSRRFEGSKSEPENQQLNQKLSEERAASVGAALVQRGIAKERIQTHGHGYTKPLYPDATQLSINRRIEIMVADEVQNEEEPRLP